MIFVPAITKGRVKLFAEAFIIVFNFSEGWEKLGLYEYYKAKNAARKQKEEEIANGRRERSRSPTPIPKDLQKQPSPPGRRYRFVE